MNLTDYSALAPTFAVYPKEAEREYLALGLLAECGELAGVYAKAQRGDSVPYDDYRERVISELGDLCWFVTMIARRYGMEVQYHGAPGFVNDGTLVSMLTVHLHSLALRTAARMIEYDDCGLFVDLWNMMGLIGELAARIQIKFEVVLRYNADKLTARRTAGVLKGSGERIEERE